MIEQREKLEVCCQVLNSLLEKNSEKVFFFFFALPVCQLLSCSAPAGGGLHHGSLQLCHLLSNWELYVWVKGNWEHLCLPYSAIRQCSDCLDQDLVDDSLSRISSLLQAHCSTQTLSAYGQRFLLWRWDLVTFSVPLLWEGQIECHGKRWKMRNCNCFLFR